MSGPRVFGLPHLSEDAVAAFADGVLSAAAASRAQRHCDECAECADAVRGQRETAMMLRAAQAPPLPSGLLDRLAGLPMSAPLPPPRGGLPTVLGADGTVMFVAHDMRKASPAAQRPDNQRPDNQQPDNQQPDNQQPDGRALTQARPSHRRATLPVTVLASAAAVVAAGTFGGHVSTLAATAGRQAPSGAANAAGSLTGGGAGGAGGQAPVRSTSPLAGAASLLPGLAAGGAFSLTVAPLRRAAQSQGPAASAGAAQHPARLTERSLTGFAAMMAGAPTAAP